MNVISFLESLYHIGTVSYTHLDVYKRQIPYWSLAVMEAELGNFKSAYHYLDTFVMVQDSLAVSYTHLVWVK